MAGLGLTEQLGLLALSAAAALLGIILRAIWKQLGLLAKAQERHILEMGRKLDDIREQLHRTELADVRFDGRLRHTEEHVEELKDCTSRLKASYQALHERLDRMGVPSAHKAREGN